MKRIKSDEALRIRWMQELIFAGKYAGVLLFLTAFAFGIWVRCGSPLGGIECTEALIRSAFSTLMLSVVAEIFLSYVRRFSVKT